MSKKTLGRRIPPPAPGVYVNLFKGLVHVWACPDAVERLWTKRDQLACPARDDEVPRFPDVEDPLGIAGELLVSAFRNKAYTVTDPCEVVVNAGDIKSVSIVEAGDQERAYKV